MELNVDFQTMFSFLSKIENKFEDYKETLLDYNIQLPHYSSNYDLNEIMVNQIQILFPKESNLYQSPLNFYNNLRLINYIRHSAITSYDILKEFNPDVIISFSITIENLLILKSFHDLIKKH